MDIVWGGIIGPDPSGCEVTLVDNGSDWGARINAADVALGAKAGAICCQGGGNIASQIILNTGASSLRTLRFGAGTWTNSLFGVPTIRMNSHTVIEGHGWDTILMEMPDPNPGVASFTITYASTGPFDPLVQLYDFTVRNLQVSGVGVNRPGNGITSAVISGLVQGGLYENIWFNKTHAIGLTLGESSPGTPVCQDVIVRGCKFTNVGGGTPPDYAGGGGVTFAIVNGNRVLVDNCTFIDALGNTVIDFEPNTLFDPITNITISNCFISNELTTGNCEPGCFGIVMHTAGAFSYQQTDDTAVCARGVYCSPLALSAGTGTQHSERQARLPGGATLPGSSPSTLGLAANQTTVMGWSYEIVVGDVNGIQWYAGTWTIRLNVNAANANVTWTNVDICRVSSGCVSQASIGSASGLGISLGSTGVKTATVTGIAQAPSAGDKVIVLLGFTNSAASAQTVGIVNDQIIDSPFGISAPYSPAVGPIEIIGCTIRGAYGRPGGAAPGQIYPTGHLETALYVNYGSSGGQSYKVTMENCTVQAAGFQPFIFDAANDNVVKNNSFLLNTDNAVAVNALRNTVSGNYIATISQMGATPFGIVERTVSGGMVDYNSFLNNTVTAATTLVGTHSVVSGETVIARPSFTPVYTPLPSGTITTTNTNDLLIAIAQEQRFLQIAAPLTALQTTNVPNQLSLTVIVPGYRLLTSAGTYTASWTNEITAQWLVAVLALKGSAVLVQQIDAGHMAFGSPSLTPSTTGGSLGTGTYYYRWAGIYNGGEFLFPEASVAVTGPTGSVAHVVSSLNGPTYSSYKIYRGTAPGVYTVYYTTASLSFTDTGAAGTAGSPPAALAYTGTLGATPTNGNAIALTYCYQANTAVGKTDLSTVTVGGVALTKGPSVATPWGITSIWYAINVTGATNGIVTATLAGNTVGAEDKVWFNASEWSGVLTTNAVDAQVTNSFPLTW